MRLDEARPGIPRVPSGIDGFDLISFGGMPANRCMLVAGTAGVGKTIFALQFLLTGIFGRGETGVLVTFEETPSDLAENVEAFGWAVGDLAQAKRLAIVDATADETPADEVGPFELDPLIARIRAAVEEVGADRVVLDSIGALLALFGDNGRVRRELRRVVSAVRQMGVTTIITAERTEDYGPIARHEVEEFVVDGVILLRHQLEGQRRRRTLEIVKMRGGNHRKGEFPYSIEGGTGFSVIPLSAVELEKSASRNRKTVGNPGVDGMLGGGPYGDSIILVSGPTGTGKTLLSTEFMRPVVERGERGIYITFEESRDQLARNAAGWGVDLGAAITGGQLDVLALYPERIGLEDLLVALRRTIRRRRPDRLVIDSLSALERISSDRAYREFVVGLITALKEAEVLAMMTNTASTLVGGDTVTETYVSTLTDAIVLLRYVEMEGEVRRALAVIKLRGSSHDHTIREFAISDRGMTIGEPLRRLSGFLTGQPDDPPAGAR